jgi:hypothetical protein
MQDKSDGRSEGGLATCPPEADFAIEKKQGMSRIEVDCIMKRADVPGFCQVMKRNTALYCSIATTVIVACLHILWSHSESYRWILNELFIWGFLGLAVINILLFVLPLCSGLRTFLKSSAKSESHGEDRTKAEEKLAATLQGDTVARRGMPAWARIGIAVCIGLIAGSILGFIVNKNIHRIL